MRKQEEALDGYHEAMECHLGDFAEYAELRRRLTDREKELTRDGAVRRRAASGASLAKLKPGDVIMVPAGRRSGVAVVLDPGLTERRQHPLDVAHEDAGRPDDESARPSP